LKNGLDYTSTDPLVLSNQQVGLNINSVDAKPIPFHRPFHANLTSAAHNPGHCNQMRASM